MRCLCCKKTNTIYFLRPFMCTRKIHFHCKYGLFKTCNMYHPRFCAHSPKCEARNIKSIKNAHAHTLTLWCATVCFQFTCSAIVTFNILPLVDTGCNLLCCRGMWKKGSYFKRMWQLPRWKNEKRTKNIQLFLLKRRAKWTKKAIKNCDANWKCTKEMRTSSRHEQHNETQ